MLLRMDTVWVLVKNDVKRYAECDETGVWISEHHCHCAQFLNDVNKHRVKRDGIFVLALT